MINLNQLRAFYEAAKDLNFSTAARRLCITQPAVTAQVRLFEDYLELKLFRKKGGKMRLTEAGQALFEMSHTLFSIEKDIESAVDEIKKVKRGRLQIGTARTYASHFMPDFISTFRHAYPKIKLDLNEGGTDEILRLLRHLEIEVALVAKTRDYPDLHLEPVSREELVLIGALDNPLCFQPSVTVQELANVLMIMKDSGSGTRYLVDDLFNRHHLNPKILMESSDAEVIKLLVRNGEGVAFLMRQAVQRELTAGTLAAIPLAGDTMRLDICMAYLKDASLSPPATAFVEQLRNWSEQMRLGLSR